MTLVSGSRPIGRFTNGTFYYTRLMDEARIQSGILASNWVRANWMTVASNTSFASYSTVTQQSPALSVSMNSGGLVLQWPASGVGFALYTATNVGPTAIWTLTTNQQTLLNGQWKTIVSEAFASSRFYRLQSQKRPFHAKTHWSALSCRMAFQRNFVLIAVRPK